MTYDKQDLQNRIVALSEPMGLTLYQLEKKIGLSRNTLARCNESALSWDKLSIVADFFNISLDVLTGRFISNPPSPAALMLMSAANNMNFSLDMAYLVVEIMESLNLYRSKVLR